MTASMVHVTNLPPGSSNTSRTYGRKHQSMTASKYGPRNQSLRTGYVESACVTPFEAVKVGLRTSSAVDPQLESARLQPISL
jgi:hypothetical protein